MSIHSGLAQNMAKLGHPGSYQNEGEDPQEVEGYLSFHVVYY